MRPKRTRAAFRFLSVLFCCVLLTLCGAWPAGAAEKSYHHLVILGDPHLPGNHIESKEQVIRNINSWDDVDSVVALGDICQDLGADAEYEAAQRFFAGLTKPLHAIPGNHDVIYSGSLAPNGKRVRAMQAVIDAKLSKFRETFGLPAVYYSRKVGGYLLVFLSTEHPGHLAEISARQLDWLRSELAKNKTTATIVFFHAPLQGTLRNYNENANKPDFIAQPAEEIHATLMGNPQAFLWVSGHTHTSPKEESFAAPVNVYAQRVTNIHTPDMNRAKIWTHSLFLYPDKVVVKTYEHPKGAWLPEFERTIKPPTF